MKITKNFVKWLAKEDHRGISSNTIATVMSGINCMGRWGKSHPRDPSDFIRCENLLKSVPAFRKRLHEMKAVSQEWSLLVDNWAEIKRMIDKGLKETNGERCTEAYKYMKALEEKAKC